MEDLFYEVSDLSTLSDDVKSRYTEVQKKDGTKVYHLTGVKGVKPESEFAVVYDTMQKEREQRKSLENKLKEYGDITPESYKQLENDYNTLKAAGKPNEDFIKQTDKLKQDHAAALLSQKQSFEAEKQQLLDSIKQKDSLILDMKFEREFETAYSPKGFPGSYLMALREARANFSWNESLSQFRTEDGLYDIKEWTENVLFKNNPNLLKGNISANASESMRTATGVAKYFDKNSPEFNRTKQVEVFRENPTKARELWAKFGK